MDPEHVPGEGRIAALGTGATALGFVYGAVRAAPERTAAVFAVLAVVFVGLTCSFGANRPSGADVLEA